MVKIPIQQYHLAPGTLIHHHVGRIFLICEAVAQDRHMNSVKMINDRGEIGTYTIEVGWAASPWRTLVFI